MREITQAHQSVVEHRSTERVCVDTKVCRISRPAERVCVGDQRMGCRFGKWLHFEPVKAIHFSTATASRTPAPDDHSGVFPFLIKRGKHSAAMDQRIRLCNASLTSFAVICKAASHSCPFNSLSLALLPCFGRLFV